VAAGTIGLSAAVVVAVVVGAPVDVDDRDGFEGGRVSGYEVLYSR